MRSDYINSLVSNKRAALILVLDRLKEFDTLGDLNSTTATLLQSAISTLLAVEWDVGIDDTPEVLTDLRTARTALQGRIIMPESHASKGLKGSNLDLLEAKIHTKELERINDSLLAIVEYLQQDPTV